MTKFILRVTASNKECANSEANIILLGDWCRSSIDKNEKVVGYHWNDRLKLFNDYQYILSLHEQYQLTSSQRLNNIHETNQCKEYWRVVIGLWLHYFISIFLDRYEMLSYATDNVDLHHVRIPLYQRNDWVPIDYMEFNARFYSDEWNYYLFFRNYSPYSFG